MTKELKLVAVCDRRKEYESIVPDGVRFYPDFQDLLSDDNIDTVIVATPNHTHYYIAMNALTAGKDLILEKPAAEGIEEVRNLEQTAAQKECSIYYAFHAATAYDVIWTQEYLNQPDIKKELGEITGFSARFYDPYIVDGALKREAEGLQNCWLDSGINALSVIRKFVNIENIQIDNVSAAMNGKAKPGITQCMAEYRFQIVTGDRSGFGVVDTNWTTGRNHKSTRLFFGKSGNVLNMDHTAQKVYRTRPDGQTEELANLSSGRERLLNHYLGLFEDFFQHKRSSDAESGMNNRDAVKLHELLFQTEAAMNRPLG